MQSNREGYKRSILDYLVHHPDAKDTEEGILTWWLTKRLPTDHDKADIRRALDDLVARGWVVRRETSGEPIYSLGQGRLDEVRRYLSRAEDEGITESRK